jgi:membrane protein YqaA with SNARE-associated domain
METAALLGGLFASALLAATVIPGASEVVLASLQLKGFNPFMLWGIATCGNVLGSLGNWWLGRAALRWRDRRWFPVKPAALEKATDWFRRWGQPALLLSWLPGVGDAFTVAAGVLRMPLLTFLVLVAVAKGARYAVLLGAVAGVDHLFL